MENALRTTRPMTSNTQPKSSYEMGESSGAGSLRNATPATASTNMGSGFPDRPEDSFATAGHDGRARKKHKARLSSGFLLNDATTSEQGRRSGSSTRNPLQDKGKGAHKAANASDTSAGHDAELRFASARHSWNSLEVSPRALSRGEREESEDGLGFKQASPSRPNSSGLNTEYTQIVNMALSLSEIRRAAAHQPTVQPPRLAPIPDFPSGSNLRQHLQQQRRTSRNISPRSGQRPRIPSGLSPATSRQAEFNTNYENLYSYSFSASTLARAQKVKEHLELMALYRDVLQYLPPLKPGYENQSDHSIPDSPNSPKGMFKFNSQDHQHSPGRPYNPLQYIRNRKVRARERKVIDGERQGFGNVESVKAWVDAIAQRYSSAASSQASERNFDMPTFPSAEHTELYISPESPSKSNLKARRRRVDWIVDPCDLVADAYWLEQDDHKNLIEDRRWRKIFPPKETSRPISRHIDEPSPGIHPQLTSNTGLAQNVPDVQDAKVQLPDGEAPGARERARQKLHGIRGFHHKHASSLHGHDLLHLRKDSLSDMSESDSERRLGSGMKLRPRRKNTITSDANELLQKQMMDIVAQEIREREVDNLPETKVEYDEQLPYRTSLEKGIGSKNSSVTHSRKASVAEGSEPDPRSTIGTPRLGSPVRYQAGRASLEMIGHGRRASDSSMQSSLGFNGLEEFRIYALAPNTSGQSSRAASPTRNPISRAKQKLRDRSMKDHAAELQTGDVEEGTHDPSVMSDHMYSPDKVNYRADDENWKGGKKSGSVQTHPNEQPARIRGIFKGPRFDSVLRGGVSKITDIIWKKESDGLLSDTSSLDGFESDATSGRLSKARPLLPGRKSTYREQSVGQPKYFYDNLPRFQHVGDILSMDTSGHHRLAAPTPSRPVSRQSSRWEKFRPPRIDVHAALGSPSLAPDQAQEPDMSDIETYQHDAANQDKRAGDMLNKPRPLSRHWSIIDHSSAPQKARLTKREVARMRALILSSGIKAMEISRRAHEMQKPLSKESLAASKRDSRLQSIDVSWKAISELCPDRSEFEEMQMRTCDAYVLASRALGMAIQYSGQRWQSSADTFATKTTPSLQQRICTVRSRLVDDLSEMTRQAADDADETSKELALDQPLKVKHVMDVIDKLLRQRRRRFRWLRRSMWLAVEWALVGFMWYVWFVVVILRVVWGLGSGLVRGMRWLLFL